MRISDDINEQISDLIPHHSIEYVGEIERFGRPLHQWTITISDEHFNSFTREEKPKLASVLYWLIMDGAVTMEGSFEDWCEELHYNPDSIRDLKIYDEHRENYLRLRKVLTPSQLEQIEELLLDW